MDDEPLQTPSHVRMAASGNDLFVLDVANDRYLGLPGAIAEGGLRVAGAGWRLDPAAAATLIEAGLLTAASGLPVALLAQSPRLVARGRSAAAKPTFRQGLDLIWATATVGLRVRRGSTGRQVHNRTTAASPVPEDHLADLMSRLDALRLLVPTPRRCLPWAMTTCLWLRRQGVSAEIVFGVRSHPFEAHCWAEHAGMVLDDDPDRILGFVPIAVAVP